MHGLKRERRSHRADDGDRFAMLLLHRDRDLRMRYQPIGLQ